MIALLQTTATLEEATKNGVHFHAKSLSDPYVEYTKVSMERYVDQLAYNLNQRDQRKQLVICKSDILGFYNDQKPAEGFMYLGDIIFTSGNDDEGHDEYWYPLSHAALLVILTYKTINKKRFTVAYNGSDTLIKAKKELEGFSKAVTKWVKENPEKARQLCEKVVMAI